MTLSGSTLLRMTERVGRWQEMTEDLAHLTATLDLEAAAERYRRLRAVGRELTSQVLKVTDGGDIEAAARQLGMWHRGMIVADCEAEMDVLYDHTLFRPRRDGENAVHRYRRELPPAPGSDEDLWLRAAADSRYALWLITGRSPGFGIAVRDLFGGEAALVADFHFSHTAPPGLVLAGRMLSNEDFSWATGATLPIADDRLLEHIRQYLERTLRKVKDLRQVDPHRAYLAEAFITRACLEAGSAERIRLENL